MRYLSLLSLLMLVHTSHAASIETNLQASSQVAGSGSKACEVACIRVCGSGVLSEEVVGIQNILGLGESETEAFQTAKALCQSQSSITCSGKGMSAAVRTLVLSRGGWETGLKVQNVNGVRRTVEYLKSERVEATESNCAIR